MPLVWTDESVYCPHCGAKMASGDHCEYSDPNCRDGFIENCWNCGKNFEIVSEVYAVFTTSKEPEQEN